MATMTQVYERKVREIALLQCRCESGSDLETELPRADKRPEEGRSEAEHPAAV